MFPIWLRFLPFVLRFRIEHRHNLLRILDNIGWLFFDKILRMGVGLLVGVWLARYLGPEQFGQLNYAIAFVGLFGAIAGLGLNGIAVRDLVKEPESANATLGTAFVLQVIGGLIAFLLIIGSIVWLRPDDTLTKTMVAVLGFALVFKATEVVKYWFESQVQSRYTVWVENGVFLAMASAKVAMILSHAPLLAFVWLSFAEAVLVAGGVLLTYAWRGGHFAAWKPCFERAKNLLNDSWPLILSGVAIMVYMRIDQIMVGQMLGDEAVGIYTAAVRLSEVWYFVPMTIVASVFPSIIKAKKQSEVLYYQRLQKLYDLMVLLALALAVPMTFLSDWVVVLLYGNDFAQAGSVLAIQVWAGVFVAIGVASSKWFLVEKLQKIHFRRTLLGAVVNIIMNAVLIRFLGITGAAIATIVSYSIAAFLSDVLFKETRIMFVMKSRSFYKNSFLIKQ